MNRKKLLTGPYFFWAVAFILIPLAMVLYYGLTDVDGHLTYENLLRSELWRISRPCASLCCSLLSAQSSVCC